MARSINRRPTPIFSVLALSIAFAAGFMVNLPNRERTFLVLDLNAIRLIS
jgi:hypothetical protein